MGRAVAVEDDFEDEEELEADIIGQRYMDVEMKKLVGANNDPFMAIPRAMLDKNTKRRVDRLQKRYTGAGAQVANNGFVSQTSSSSTTPFMTISNPTTKGGAQAKYLTPEQVYNGYFIWHLATPPFNMDYLTELMIANPTHSGCIRAKATNIVGLGYHWEETSKVKLARQDVSENDAQVNKLAKKLVRVTDGLNDYTESLNNVDTFRESKGSDLFIDWSCSFLYHAS